MKAAAPPWLTAALVALASPALAQTVTFATGPRGVAPVTFDLDLTGNGIMGLWAVAQEEGRAFDQRTVDPRGGER